MRKNYDWVDDFFNQSFTGDAKVIVERLKKNTRMTDDDKKEDSNSMLAVYDEIQKKVPDVIGRHNVLGAIIDCARLYEAKKLIRRNTRYKDSDLENIQKKVCEKAEDLITVLNQYAAKKEEGLFDSEGDTAPIKLIIKAGLESGPVERQMLFKCFVLPSMQGLNRFDGKYMPDLQDLLGILISELDNNPVMGVYPDIDAVFDSQKISPADFVRGFDVVIDEFKRCWSLPSKFKLTDDALATTAQVVLGLGKKSIGADLIRKARKKRAAKTGTF